MIFYSIRRADVPERFFFRADAWAEAMNAAPVPWEGRIWFRNDEDKTVSFSGFACRARVKDAMTEESFRAIRFEDSSIGKSGKIVSRSDEADYRKRWRRHENFVKQKLETSQETQVESEIQKILRASKDRFPLDFDRGS